MSWRPRERTEPLHKRKNEECGRADKVRNEPIIEKIRQVPIQRLPGISNWLISKRGLRHGADSSGGPTFCGCSTPATHRLGGSRESSAALARRTLRWSADPAKGPYAAAIVDPRPER